MTEPTEAELKEARKLAVMVLTGSGYWIPDPEFDAADHVPDGVVTLLARALRAARSSSTGWVPIDENAPKDKAVLVYGFGYEVAHFNTALGAWVSCWDHRKLSRVTHWMPLPEPPSDGETGGGRP